MKKIRHVMPKNRGHVLRSLHRRRERTQRMIVIAPTGTHNDVDKGTNLGEFRGNFM